MRIAILSCFYPFRGGMSQFNTCLFGELAKHNTVKAFNFTRQYPNFLFPGKTQYVTPEDNAVPVESEALLDTANPFSYITTAKAIKAWKPDVLIMRYWMSYFAPSLGYVARHLNKECKIVSIVDNVIPHEQHFFDKPFTKYFLNANDGCVVFCDAVQQDLLNLKPDAKFINTPHPLYTHFGEKLEREKAEDIIGVPHGKKNLLFFGFIREYKGLDILLEAFNQLDSSYNLIIVGEPYGSFEKYQKIIDNSPLKDNIFLNTNYLPDSEVNKYFSAADVCVLPYRSATQSGISSASYYFEIPLITTNVGGLKQMIGDRGTGLLTEAVTPDAVAASIKEYFSSDIRESLVANIKREKERLSWETFCNKIVNFAKTL